MTAPDKAREQLVARLRGMTLTREEITRIRSLAVGRRFVEISANTLIALTEGARLAPEAATFIEQHCAPEGEAVAWTESEERSAFNEWCDLCFPRGRKPEFRSDLFIAWKAGRRIVRPSPASERAEVVAFGECDCGAQTEGPWADKHHPSCPALSPQRREGASAATLDQLTSELEYAYRVIDSGFKYSNFDFSVLRSRADEYIRALAPSAGEGETK